MGGYRFFVSNKYERNKEKESEFIHRDRSCKNKITFQVKDQVPIDFLDRMSDKDKDLKLICEQVAEDFLKNQEGEGDQDRGGKKDKKSASSKDHRSSDADRFLISSKPYARKNNVTSDKALNFCWEIHLRFNEYDLYVSILRRSYIPPLMDMHQDIVVCSKFCFKLNSNPKAKAVLPQRPQHEQENNHNSFKHLQEVHRKIIDSIHQIDIGSQTTIFKVILEKRANALLFSEDTLNFYQYNLQVFPTDFLKYAVSYLMRLMSTLLNYNA